MQQTTASTYDHLIVRLKGCAALILESKVLDEPLRDELKAQIAIYAVPLDDLASGKLKPTDAGMDDLLNDAQRFCSVIETELADA